MTFQALMTFLETQMRMSHIYQPVMIKHLLEKGGDSTDVEIAKEIAKYDQSQIEYYQKITNNMVGRVLRSHQIVGKQKTYIASKVFNISAIQGFNIGVNSGTVAEQTIMHCHTHLIPRKEKDVDDPRGGVRHIIPNKGYY